MIMLTPFPAVPGLWQLVHCHNAPVTLTSHRNLPLCPTLRHHSGFRTLTTVSCPRPLLRVTVHEANVLTGAPLQRSCEQPSNVRSVYKCFCELSELVHESLYILHSPGRPLTSRDLINIYTDFLNWYDNIPEVLRLGHNFTPAVLFAQ